MILSKARVILIKFYDQRSFEKLYCSQSIRYLDYLVVIFAIFDLFSLKMYKNIYYYVYSKDYMW